MIAATKPLSLIKANVLPLVIKPTKARNVRMLVRAENADKSENVVDNATEATVFYGGKDYSATEVGSTCVWLCGSHPYSSIPCSLPPP
jgi:hypothetical protein